jgi:aspartate aminotransferase-like enzyme/predicted N-acetyltransferase YhbS
MLRIGGYVFKRAETSQEFDEIHRLNYRTFVSEVPQHPDTGNGLLVDKFHDKNIYFIAVYEGRVVGMVSAHDQPPFSVTERLSDPSLLQRPGTRLLEVRLLAVEPGRRHSRVLPGLLWGLLEYARASGHTHMVISGLQDRVSLYQHLGFRSIGPAVPEGTVAFVPMELALRRIPARLERFLRQWEAQLARARTARAEAVCLLPGPVVTSAAVCAAFKQPPLYHRGPEFIALFDKVRRALSSLVGGRDVALLNGSGTLANETVAATLAADPQEGRGVLLVNGEFGQRLARQATRFGLHPRLLTWRWGQPWNLDEVAAALADEPPGSWVWGVHLESSTGVLNDLPGLVRLARSRGIRVCADCISSFGAVPLDLRDVYQATAASGKSLGAYAGVAIVFADAAPVVRLDMSRVPSYLDLPAALASPGPLYTFPSPQLRALEAALANWATPELARSQYDRYAALGAYVRQQLRTLRLPPLAEEQSACPVVTTFAPPEGETSESFVARCRAWGFAIGGQSGYLKERRLVQIATMGAVTHEAFAPLFEQLSRWLVHGLARAVG